ncbi:MAG TPA: YgjP-like metallopeptidase domain-containing protein, partial [Bacteroidota bacterium]|nr:YgjP-like metallopeptidase domain-containing protein [Bacteroidota bacterium]
MTGTIRLGETDVPFVVRESSRASRPSLRIRDGSAVEVVLPLRAGGARVELLLRRHARWILRTLERLRREPGSVPLESGSRLALNGIERLLRIEREDRRRSSVHVSEEEIL